MEFGVIKSVSIEKNLDSDVPTRMIEVEVHSSDDQPVEAPPGQGVDFNPPKGSRVYFNNVSAEFGVAVMFSDETTPASDLGEGERETYAVKDKARVATIRQKSDGSIVLQEGSDNAIRYSEMEKAFEELKKEFNALLDLYNAHIHLTGNAVVGAPVAVAPTTSVGTPAKAEMSAAKIDEINTP